MIFSTKPDTMDAEGDFWEWASPVRAAPARSPTRPPKQDTLWVAGWGNELVRSQK